MSETFPNKSRHEASPLQEREGIGIALAAVQFEPKLPIILRGTFCVGDATRRSMAGLFEPRIMLVVVRCDQPALWSRPLEHAHRRALTHVDPSIPIDPTLLERGFFNVDLAALCDVLEPDARYWAMACFGDHVSERCFFSIGAPS